MMEVKISKGASRETITDLLRKAMSAMGCHIIKENPNAMIDDGVHK